jgi:hypothetical protein
MPVRTISGLDSRQLPSLSMKLGKSEAHIIRKIPGEWPASDHQVRQYQDRGVDEAVGLTTETNP